MVQFLDVLALKEGPGAVHHQINALEKSKKAMSVGFLLSRDLVQSLKQEGSSESVDQPAM